MVLGVPLLENRKVTKLPFHIFDRYETHFQDFEDFVWGSSSLSGARLHNFKVSKVKKSNFGIVEIKNIKHTFGNFIMLTLQHNQTFQRIQHFKKLCAQTFQFSEFQILRYEK